MDIYLEGTGRISRTGGENERTQQQQQTRWFGTCGFFLGFVEGGGGWMDGWMDI